MKKILFAAFAALSMIACNKDDATTVIPDIDNTLNGAIDADCPRRRCFRSAEVKVKPLTPTASIAASTAPLAS